MIQYVLVHIFFFFKQKTAYEMRISDWSSDVCSSDLRDVIIEPDEAQIAEIGERVDVEIGEAQEQRRRDGQREEQPQRGERGRHEGQGGKLAAHAGVPSRRPGIGRASCRERVGRYVKLAVGAVSLKKQ